jgi:hypothetical protein
MNEKQSNKQEKQSILLEKYILDPLSVIIKLAILAKKPIGSKITIDSNTIFIQEIGPFQGLVRFVYNGKKEEIQYLYNPIEFACSRYLTDTYIKKYPRLKILFQNAINGLDKLYETYKQNIIFTHAIFMYKSLISNHLSKSVVGTKTVVSTFNPLLFIPDSITNEYTNEIIDNFSLIWNDERINIVLNMIEFIDADSVFDKSIKCLEDLLNIIDKEIQSKVEVYNQSITLDNQINEQNTDKAEKKEKDDKVETIVEQIEQIEQTKSVKKVDQIKKLEQTKQVEQNNKNNEIITKQPVIIKGENNEKNNIPYFFSQFD